LVIFKKYQLKEPLEDKSTASMTIKEFWRHDDKDYREFEYGKLLVPKQVHVKLSWITEKFHDWYYLACVYGLNFIEAKIPRDIFKTSDFDRHVELAELHTVTATKELNSNERVDHCSHAHILACCYNDSSQGHR
jgi:hypothetical protein